MRDVNTLPSDYDLGNNAQETTLVVLGVVGIFLFPGLGFAHVLAWEWALPLGIGAFLLMAVSDRTMRFALIRAYKDKRVMWPPEFGKLWLRHY